MNQYRKILIALIISFEMGCTPVQKIKFSPDNHSPLEKESLTSIYDLKTLRLKLSNQDTFILINEQVSLNIPQNLFVDFQGEIAKEYFLFITPFFKEVDMIMLNLQTLSGEVVLETRGMFHIDVKTIDGSNLKFNEGKSIELIVVGDYQLDDYYLYKGAKTNGTINWELAKNSNDSLRNAPPPPIDWLEPDSIYMGVNLKLNNAHEKMQQLGLTKDQIDSIIKEFQRREKAYKVSLVERTITNYYDLNSFGWFNIDKIVNLESNTKANVGVKLINLKQKSMVKVFYLFQGRKSIISGKALNDGLYTLFYSENEITPLPELARMKVIVIAKSGNSFYTASKDLDLKNGTEITLNEVEETKLYSWLDSQTMDYCATSTKLSD